MQPNYYRICKVDYGHEVNNFIDFVENNFELKYKSGKLFNVDSKEQFDLHEFKEVLKSLLEEIDKSSNQK